MTGKASSRKHPCYWGCTPPCGCPRLGCSLSVLGCALGPHVLLASPPRPRLVTSGKGVGWKALWGQRSLNQVQPLRCETLLLEGQRGGARSDHCYSRNFPDRSGSTLFSWGASFDSSTTNVLLTEPPSFLQIPS